MLDGHCPLSACMPPTRSSPRNPFQQFSRASGAMYKTTSPLAPFPFFNITKISLFHSVEKGKAWNVCFAGLLRNPDTLGTCFCFCPLFYLLSTYKLVQKIKISATMSVPALLLEIIKSCLNKTHGLDFQYHWKHIQKTLQKYYMLELLEFSLWSRLDRSDKTDNMLLWLFPCKSPASKGPPAHTEVLSFWFCCSKKNHL